VKVYILKDEDFEKLILEISRDPRHGTSGGSSDVLNAEEQRAFDKAHRFYNYVIRRWLDEVKE
jgi:hypothetical protein